MSEDKRETSNRFLVEHGIDNILGHWLALDVDDHIDHDVVDNDDDDVGDIVDCDVVEHEADNLVVPLRTDDTDGKDGHQPRTNKSNTRFSNSAFYGRCILRQSIFQQCILRECISPDRWSREMELMP